MQIENSFVKVAVAVIYGLVTSFYYNIVFEIIFGPMRSQHFEQIYFSKSALNN